MPEELERLVGIIKSEGEPFIRDDLNPLLRGTSEQGFTFASDPDEELSLARYFAAEINSGRLSVRAALGQFRSKEGEDTAEEVKLPTEVMLFLGAALEEKDNVGKLVSALSAGYLMSVDPSAEDVSSPYSTGIFTAVRIMGRRDIGDDILREAIYCALVRHENNYNFYNLLESREGVPILVRMVELDHSRKRYAVSILGYGRFEESVDCLTSLVNSDDPEAFRAACTLAEMGKETGINYLTDCALDPYNTERNMAVFVLSKTKPNLDTFIKLYEESSHNYADHMCSVEGTTPLHHLSRVVGVILNGNNEDAKKMVYRDLEGTNEALIDEIISALDICRPKDSISHMESYIARLKASEPSEPEAHLAKFHYGRIIQPKVVSAEWILERIQSANTQDPSL